MKTIHLDPQKLSELERQSTPCVVALGFFDGVHLGHRQVIREAREIARKKGVPLAVMSFFPHPKEVLSKGKQQVDYLMPVKEKQRIFEKLGVDLCYIVPFDQSFASLKPERFVKNYLLNLGALHVVAGFDYAYGYRGEGHMDRMKMDARGLLEVTKVEKVACHGEKISSTLIREKIRTGAVEELPSCLGETYRVEGRVVGTMILMKPYYMLPSSGRYVVTIHSQKGSFNTEVVVLKKPDQILIRDVEISNLVQGEQVTIEWKRCLFTQWQEKEQLLV
ncbi:FAD synthetase family protein [Bacillus sp. FJAT-47783]|uniref:FAD synthetase family protein n=1 Tax=Bacillus sp. FJAT-47783 TaxID=2922712 RepID=UPI001FACD648|nr:FAD synthetase family protein [Bacillus sp. FJAT-47783]